MCWTEDESTYCHYDFISAREPFRRFWRSPLFSLSLDGLVHASGLHSQCINVVR